MNLLPTATTSQTFNAASRGQRASVNRRCAVVVQAHAKDAVTSRRAVLAGITAAAPLLLGLPAIAKDFKEAQAEKEARKKALREAAGGIKRSGVDVEVFEVPEYSVSEEARTPNVHSRQGEGARQQNNV